MTALVGEVLPAVAGGGALSTDHRDELAELRDRWLLETARSGESARAYRGDFDDWVEWCARCQVAPTSVNRTHFSAWLRWMEETPSARTGRPLGEASLARRASSVASFYGFLADIGRIAASPIPRRGRPKAPADSTTVGLSRVEAQSIRRRIDPGAGLESTQDCALMQTLLLEGPRSAEVRNLDIGSLGYDSGHVVLDIVGKGRKARRVVVSAPAVDAVERMLAIRAAAAGVPVEDLDPRAPLFVAVHGGRLSQQQVARVVRRVCRAAGVKAWARLTPHGLRHAFITLTLDSGADIHVVADHVGHASVRTTQRYDRRRGALSRSPVHGLAAFTEPEGEQ